MGITLPDIDQDNWLADMARAMGKPEIPPHARAASKEQLFDLYRKYNPYHEPAGSGIGGEFAHGPGGGLGPVRPVLPTETQGVEPAQQYLKDAGKAVGAEPPVMVERPDASSFESAIAEERTPSGYHIAGMLKAQQCEDLAARMGADPSEVNSWLKSWAGGYGSDMQLAIVAAAGKKWGLAPGWYADRIGEKSDGDSVYTRLDGDYTWGSLVDRAGTFLDAQYAATQEYYSSRGIKYADVVRGVAFDPGGETQEFSGLPEPVNGEPQWTDASMQMSPLSQWSSVYDVAYTTFAQNRQGLGGTGAPYVLSARVPVERILSNGITGIGASREAEHIIIGAPAPEGVKVAKVPYEGGRRWLDD